jgi:hypothetical protein
MPPIQDVCSPNSSGQKPKPTPLPHPGDASRKVQHAAVYGDRRNDQLPHGSLASRPRPGET